MKRRFRHGVAGLALALVAVALSACSDDPKPVSSEEFPALTGSDVIATTKAEGTATATSRNHASVADPPEEHGTSGYEEEDLIIEAQFDFGRDRVLVEWEFPPFDLGEEASPPIKVEARSIGDTAYVRDGSWLCPGCGLDGDEPLPTDKWITVPIPVDDKAFRFSGGDAFAGDLGWIALVTEPVQPSEMTNIDSEDVAWYHVELPVDVVDDHATLGLQGEVATVSFAVDDERRLRRLVVRYRSDDRNRIVAARVGEFGEPVDIEIPPVDEIYDESE